MFQKFKTISSKLLAIGVVIAVLIVVLVGLDFCQKNLQKKGLNDNELLKAPKEKIIDYQVIGEDSNDPENSAQNTLKNPGSIIKYRYISDQEVPAETYQGLKEDISKRTENSQTFLKSVTPISDKLQKEEYIGRFYTTQTFQKSGDKWYQVETATTTPQAFYSQTKLTLLDKVKGFLGREALADTFYSGEGDGVVYKNDNEDWIPSHDATAGSGYSDTAVMSTVGVGDEFFGKVYIYRNFLPFDTSALPADAVITGADLEVYTIAKWCEVFDVWAWFAVVETSQPDITSLENADYDQIGSGIIGEQIFCEVISEADFNSFEVTTSYVKRNGESSSCGPEGTTGVTCLGLREGNDILDHDFEGVTESGNSMQIRTVEYTGTSQDPRLEITYETIQDVVKIDGGVIKIDGGTIKIN